MSSENWRCYTLGEICSFTGGTVFPQKVQGDTQGTVPFIKVSDFNINGNERWIVNANNYVYQEDIKKLNAKLHPAYATVFAKIGIALTFNRRRLLLVNTIIDNNLASAKPYQEIIDPIYFYYLLLTIDFNKVISGTAVPYLNFSDLQKIEVTIPDISTQRRIAEILSALDDKIELNRQTNATLEAVAQALFKEWFVHFNFPGADGELVDSELGPIPKGWRVGRLGEVCELVYGKGLTSETRIEGRYPVVGSNGIVGTHNDYLVEGPGIVIGRKGTIGEVTWVHQNFFPIDTTFYINDLLGINGLYFHYFLLKEQDFKKIASDSAVPGLNRNQAYASLIVIPTKDAINQYNNFAQTIFAGIFNYSNESSTLAAIRDALLPKLMNGEIEV